jgi:SAM-dependent methyltransferase
MMRLRERFPPDPRTEVGGLNEVFRHPIFTEASDEERARIMWESASSRYEDEQAFTWDNYFGRSVQPWVRGDVLDLGCFTGGRAVAWWDRYQPASMRGMDVEDVFIDAARRFAEAKGAPLEFRVGVGESIPWPDRSFDTIVSFDVLEHVRSVPATLHQCWRTLRPGGHLIAVFPSYFQPIEHHLSLVTDTPGLQYLFSPSTQIAAYREIIAERGGDVSWYARGALEPWERGNTINGTTNYRFRRLLRQQGWSIVFQSRLPIGAVGRRRARSGRGALLARACRPLTGVAGLQEVALHRLAYVLRRG